MRQFIFAMLTAMVLTSACYQEATAGCAKDDRICNDAVNNAAARQKAADDARTKELNRQNGASQYTGPTGGYDPKHKQSKVDINGQQNKKIEKSLSSSPAIAS